VPRGCSAHNLEMLIPSNRHLDGKSVQLRYLDAIVLAWKIAGDMRRLVTKPYDGMIWKVRIGPKPRHLHSSVLQPRLFPFRTQIGRVQTSRVDGTSINSQDLHAHAHASFRSIILIPD